MFFKSYLNYCTFVFPTHQHAVCPSVLGSNFAHPLCRHNILEENERVIPRYSRSLLSGEEGLLQTATYT